MANRGASRGGRRCRSGGSVEGGGPARDGIDQHLAFDIYETPGYLIRRLHQIVVGLFYDKTAENGVTPVQYAALIAVRRHPGIDQLRLAQVIAFDRSTIGSVLERLERRGLVRRTTDAQDRRRKSLYLTPEGAALLRQIQPAVRSVQKKLLAALDAEERTEFVRLLAKIVDLNNDVSRAPLTLPRDLSDDD